jgi:hypothetical protein
VADRPLEHQLLGGHAVAKRSLAYRRRTASTTTAIASTGMLLLGCNASPCPVLRRSPSPTAHKAVKGARPFSDVGGFVQTMAKTVIVPAHRRG